MGDDGDLGAVAGLTGDVDDLHGPVGQLGYFQLQEPAHQVGVAAGDDDLGALGLVANLDDEGLDPVAPLQTFEGDPLAAGEDRLGVTQVEDHGTEVDLLDDAGDQVTLPAFVHLVYLLPLRLPQFELHHLFEGLGGDTTEGLPVGGVLPLADDVAVFVQLLGVDLHLPRFGVDGDPGLLGGAGAALVGGHQGVGESVEDLLDRHPPLPGEDLDGLHHCVQLHASPSVARLGGLLPPKHGPGSQHVGVSNLPGSVLALHTEGLLTGVGEDPPEGGLRISLGHFHDHFTAYGLDEVGLTFQLALQPR